VDFRRYNGLANCAIQCLVPHSSINVDDYPMARGYYVSVPRVHNSLAPLVHWEAAAQSHAREATWFA